jgi:hypothetical protein
MISLMSPGIEVELRRKLLATEFTRISDAIVCILMASETLLEAISLLAIIGSTLVAALLFTVAGYRTIRFCGRWSVRHSLDDFDRASDGMVMLGGRWVARSSGGSNDVFVVIRGGMGINGKSGYSPAVAAGALPKLF